jgi:hypothetical protein
MDFLFFIWNFLRGVLLRSRQSAGAFVSRQLAVETAIWQICTQLSGALTLLVGCTRPRLIPCVRAYPVRRAKAAHRPIRLGELPPGKIFAGEMGMTGHVRRTNR